MDPERWKHVDSLLQAVLARPPDERDAFLRQACVNDDALEREVRSLLAAQEQAGSFLESPAIDVAARALASLRATTPQRAPGSLIGQTISHYRIVGKVGAAGWAWCTRPRTLACTGSSRSSFCPKPSRAIRTRSAGSSGRRVPRPR